VTLRTRAIDILRQAILLSRATLVYAGPPTLLGWRRNWVEAHFDRVTGAAF
jgi:hypothetical protein